MISSKKKRDVIDLIKRVCTSLDLNEEGNQLTKEQIIDRANGWAEEGHNILTSGKNEKLNPAVLEEFDQYFKEWEWNETKDENLNQFAHIEKFILEEQNAGRRSRQTTRLLAASQEVRIAAEIAELKGFRIARQHQGDEDRLHTKISDAEKAYVSRKMILTKASQQAASDCRQQFARVRTFFQQLYLRRKDQLRRQYERSLKIQSIVHRLCKTDPRVMALEQNTAERIFRKKEADMGEMNMVQNLEEATYLESLMTLLDEVQQAKEAAFDAHFQLQIKDLKEQQELLARQNAEIHEMKARSTIEIAELVARYTEEDLQDQEDFHKTSEKVESLERRKDLQATSSNTLLSVSDLYDTILWSVATNAIGLSTDETESFFSLLEDVEDDQEAQAGEKDGLTFMDHREMDGLSQPGKCDETGSIHSEETANISSDSSEKLSALGNMHVLKIKKEIRAAERSLEKKHTIERKQQRRKYRALSRELKKKHQEIVDSKLAKCVDERHKLREAIANRMAMVEQNQTRTTETLQEGIEADVRAMQQAWDEHKRLEEEQKSSFAKAQALISAQVFHEVRNALSSVVAMSEMTSSLQEDSSVTSEKLVSFVNEMLGQNKEVVNYSLNMLNNILDVSKIKAGSFKSNMRFFDLQDLVGRATKMQLVKAQTRGVKMSFEPMSSPQIAYTDDDIVIRIVTNFISNAVKFTSHGAIQPFVCPIESIDRSNSTMMNATKVITNEEIKLKKDNVIFNDFRKAKMRMVAVGVADTGPGLSRELLNFAKTGLFSSDSKVTTSGAKNSGFGLHLAHQLAGTLGSALSLIDLKSFEGLYNSDMSNVMNSVKDSELNGEGSPGRGTVLYITVPVLEDGNKFMKVLKSTSKSVSNSTQESDALSKKYSFSPRPAPNSIDGCFRILVADDVLMLRKGLIRSVLDVFSEYLDCPISVSTACTAEDALRAINMQQFDLFICDNEFAPPRNHKRLPSELLDNDMRYQVCSHDDMKTMRESVTTFFAEEAFTIVPGDGTLSGVDALLKLVGETKSPFQNPILVLHSGHEIELPQQSGIIVVRKPFKRADFVPLIERNCSVLVESGMCVEVQRGNEVVILNKSGAQLFKRNSIP